MSFYGAPFRPPADGWHSPRLVFLAGSQRVLAWENLDAYAPVYTNVIQPCNVYGAPYPRVASSGCEQIPDSSCGGDCAAQLARGCPPYAWLGDGTMAPQYKNLAAFPKPTWVKQSGKVNADKAKNVGWKAVQAERIHQGIGGWKDVDCVNDGLVTCDGVTTPYRKYKAAGSQVHYLSAKYECSYSGINNTSFTSPYPVFQYSGSISGTNTIDKLSGRLTPNVHVNYSGTLIYLDPSVTEWNGLKVGDTYSYSDGLDYFNNQLVTPQNVDSFPVFEPLGSWIVKDVIDLPADCNSPNISEPGHSWSFTDTVWEETTDYDNVDEWGRHSPTKSDFKVTLLDPLLASEVFADIDALTDGWDLTNDLQYPWRTDTNLSFVPLVCRNEIGGRNPLVVIQLKTMNPDGSITNYVDPDSFYDGSVYGNPLDPQVDCGLPPDSVLLGGYFAPEMVRYELCSGRWVVASAGVFNNGQNGLPTTATHWPNERDLAWFSLSFGGCWQTSNYFNTVGGIQVGDGKLRRQKYCETKLEWDSYDFNRPYGADKFAINPKKAYCFSSEAGENISVWKCNSTAPAVNDYVLLNTPYHKGVFKVTSVTDPSPVIGTVNGNGCVFAVGLQVSVLPAGTPDGTCGVLQFSSYWSAVAPFGLLEVNATFAGGTSTVTTTENMDAWLLDSDGSTTPITQAVDFYAQVKNSSGMFVPANAPFASGVITKVDATHATCTTDVSAAKYMCPAGKQPWWYDNGMKGQVVAMGWTYDFRTGGEAGRLTGLNCGGNFPNTPFTDSDGNVHNADGTRNYGFSEFTAQQLALPFSPCCPSVMCFSNNGETWKNGVTLPIPAMEVDYHYGKLWYAEFVQAVESPVYVPPALSPWSCSHTDPTSGAYDPSIIHLLADDGSCIGDDTSDNTNLKFRSAHPPVVEPFLTLPVTNQTTAPDPMAYGLGWHVLSPVTNDPSATYSNGTVWTPTKDSMAWLFYLNACSTIANGCGSHADGEDFAAIYGTFVNCPV